MPGISMVSNCNEILPEKASASLKEMMYRAHYEAAYHVQNSRVVIGFSGYAGYPVYKYEDEKVLILLEGLVYDKSDHEVSVSLRSIARDYSQNKSYKRQIAKLIEDSDGDFIGLLYFKHDKTTLIFNDRWGRLPAFFFAEDKIFAFSREIKFLLHWISSIAFDRVAMAERLMYNYNLGEKTLIKGITRLSPATCLEIKCFSRKIKVTGDVLLPVSFETRDVNLQKNEAVRQCVKLFRESLLSRVETIQEKGLHIVADLSGGFDTRAVFGGLCQMEIIFTAATDNLVTGDESNIAYQLADSFGKTLCKFSSSHPIDDFSISRNLTYITDCSGNTWNTVSSYYDSLEREKVFSKPTAHFMGFGGEFIRHPYKLKKHYSSFVAMLKDAAYSNWSSTMTPDMSLAITKVNSQEFSQSLECEVTKFPEQKDEDKLKHLYFEYYNNGVNAGEDRHRKFSWTVQPLWGKNLFEFEMQCIPRKIICFEFFFDFLRQLDSRLLETPIHGSNMRLDSRLGSKLYLAKMRFIEFMLSNRYMPNLYRHITRKLHKTKKTPLGSDEIRKLCREEFVFRQFDVQAVKEFLAQSPRNLEVYSLIALMLYVSEVGRRFPKKIRF